MKRAGLLALNLAALALAWAVVAWTSPSSDPVACVDANACDASVFEAAARGLLAGRLPYGQALVDLDLPFAYPPWSLPLLLPWAFGRPAMLALALASNLALVSLGWRARDGLFALLLGLGGWTFFGAWLGQTGSLVGCGALLMLLGAREQRPLWEGLGVLLVLLKPHLGLPLVLVLALKGRWRGLGLGLGALATLSLIATLAWGVQAWPAWLEALASPPPALDRSYMSSWMALWPRAPHSLVLAAGALAPLTVLLARGRSLEPLLGLAAASALLWAPHSHPYDLALLGTAMLPLKRLRGLLAFVVLAHVALFAGLRAPIALGLLGLYVVLLRTPEPS